MGTDISGQTVTLLNDRAIKHALAEQLLRWTIPDLEARAASQDRYQALGAAALLRRTLTDKCPVVHLARERLALPMPVFEFTPFPAPTKTDNRMKVVLAFAGTTFAEPTTTGTLDQFLATPAAYFQGEQVSVKRLINYFAHIHGAVHLGDPEDEFERLVQRIAASVESTTSVWIRALAAVAVITARALVPLRDAIDANSA